MGPLIGWNVPLKVVIKGSINQWLEEWGVEVGQQIQQSFICSEGPQFTIMALWFKFSRTNKFPPSSKDKCQDVLNNICHQQWDVCLSFDGLTSVQRSTINGLSSISTYCNRLRGHFRLVNFSCFLARLGAKY